MYISWQGIITAGAVLGAVLAIGGVVMGIIKWFQKQDRQPKALKKLEKQHNADVSIIREELCVLSYAMLAALDGLMQQGCNGEVTKAHSALEKHLNKQAHDIHERSE